jgi:serine/threonine protein kinase/tetratricopeptide (TPR) repeat protein
MSTSATNPQSSDNSARDILEVWHLSSDDQFPEDRSIAGAESISPACPNSPNLDLPTAFPSDPFNRADRGDCTGRFGPPKAQPNSVELFAGFELDESRALWGSTQAPGRGAIGICETYARRDQSPAVAGSNASGPRQDGALPHPGDELAGFRILLELGRGAFARVYLAEELNLGRRLVAIKVSRPEGDEPQILARLQHSHIVPVHSVADDPVTGLRVLCMPYFGGANLAQVLEAIGGPVPTHHDGRSIVAALDQVSRNVSTVSSRALTQGSFRRSRTARSTGPSPTLTASVSGSKSVHNAAASRFRSLFSRFVSARARPVAGRRAAERDPKEELDLDQPSRRFLHGATATQAAVWIVARLADGLEHAHSRGLLHRDLKPSNILLAADGTPMLLDFNLSVDVLPSSADGEIHRALVGGTLPYMAPEHLDAFNPRGSTPPDAVDERSDIYALGLILFEMLAGEHPFAEAASGGSLLETIERMIAARRQVPSLRARCPQVPWSIDALVGKCLSFDPRDRYARAQDLAEDLRRFLDDLPMKFCPEPSFRERMGKWRRRHPALCGSTSIALASLVLITFLAGTVAFVYDKTQVLAARMSLRVFDHDFTETQFLLNTAIASKQHLERGLDKSSQALARLGMQSGRNPRWRAWQEHLTLEERRHLSEQVVELMMLDARARVAFVAERGTERDRARAIEQAIAALDRAEKIDVHPPSALYAERARYYGALGLADRSAADKRRAAATAPSTCHDLTLLGSSLLASGDHAGAEVALRQALHRDITSFWAWFLLGHCHFAQGRFLEAAGSFAACSARDPSFAWVHFNRGIALARAGRLLDAKLAYDRAIEIDAAFAEAVVNRALTELELNLLDAARQDLTRAIQLGRNDLVVFAALGETWARLGRLEEAERYFAGVLNRNPTDSVVRLARGISRIRKNPEGATNDFTRVLEQDPQNAQAYYGLALLVRHTDLVAALDHLDRALQANPDLIDAVQLRALVRARRGERSALDDVDRLVQSATPHRLYNAACAVAILSEKVNDARLGSHAMDLLDRAIKSGFPAAEAASDPDLKSLGSSPRFRAMVMRPAVS